jgi:FMN phosphatase YigB (HAD superfamily)
MTPHTLATLKDHGLRLGLLTNCAPDVSAILPNTALGPFFDAAVFSCTARVRKPDLRAYELVLDSLGIGPEHVLYVGEGSDEELRGAVEAGLCPLVPLGERAYFVGQPLRCVHHPEVPPEETQVDRHRRQAVRPGVQRA